MGHLRGRASDAAVSAKIRKLRGEGVPEQQAVAEALAIKRAGRLTAGGGYVRAKKGQGKV